MQPFRNGGNILTSSTTSTTQAATIVSTTRPRIAGHRLRSPISAKVTYRQGAECSHSETAEILLHHRRGSEHTPPTSNFTLSNSTCVSEVLLRFTYRQGAKCSHSETAEIFLHQRRAHNNKKGTPKQAAHSDVLPRQTHLAAGAQLLADETRVVRERPGGKGSSLHAAVQGRQQGAGVADTAEFAVCALALISVLQKAGDGITDTT